MFLSVFDIFKISDRPVELPHHGPDVGGRALSGRPERRAAERHPRRARHLDPGRTAVCTGRWPSPAKGHATDRAVDPRPRRLPARHDGCRERRGGGAGRSCAATKVICGWRDCSARSGLTRTADVIFDYRACPWTPHANGHGPVSAYDDAGNLLHSRQTYLLHRRRLRGHGGRAGGRCARECRSDGGIQSPRSPTPPPRTC